MDWDKEFKKLGVEITTIFIMVVIGGITSEKVSLLFGLFIICTTVVMAVYYYVSICPDKPEEYNQLQSDHLTGVYDPWQGKRIIEEYQISSVTRDLGGIPLVRVPPELLENANDLEGRFPIDKEVLEVHNFMELYLKGDILEEEIYNFIDRWHMDTGIDIGLPEYLGMSWEVYSAWVTAPSTLSSILASRGDITTSNQKFDVKT